MSNLLTELSTYSFWRKTFLLVLLILCAISGMVAIILTAHYYWQKSTLINNVKEAAQQETVRAAKEIQDFMSQTLPPLVSNLVNDIGSGALPKDQIKDRLKQKAINVAGVGVAFAPYAYDKDIKLYAPYYVERKGVQTETQLENLYDYTKFKRYTQPMQFGAGYLEPFYDPASETIVAEYGAPIKDSENSKIGVAFANHSTEHMQNVVQNMSLGYKGYGFLISRQGIFIAHPIREYTTQMRNIFDVAKDMKNPQLEALAREAVKGERGFIDHESTATGQQSWMFFEPIPGLGWSMVGVFIKDELELNTNNLKRKRIQIFLSFMLFLIFLTFLLLRVDTLTNARLWAASLMLSFYLLCGIIFMWYIAHVTIRYKMETEDAVIVQDRTALNRFLETAQQSASAAQAAMLQNVETMQQESPPIIPTRSDAGSSQPISVMPPQNHGAPGMSHHIDAMDAHASHQTSSHPPTQVAPPVLTNLPTGGEFCPVEKITNNEIQQNLISIMQTLQNATATLQKNVPSSGQSSDPSKEIKIRSPKNGTTNRSEIIIPAKGVSNTGVVQKELIVASARSQDHSAHDMSQSMEQSSADSTVSSAPTASSGHSGHGGGHGSTVSINDALHVPTGIYIYHLEFKGINAIKFIGTLWQRYLKSKRDNIKRGIILPLAEPVKITEVYRFDDGERETYGWNVAGEVNQRFDYSTYPFDTKLVRILISPADFDKGVVLVADLDSYKVINPTSLPGIDPSVRLQEWYMGRSFFSYNRTRYLTNFGNYLKGPFGIIDQSSKSVTPELYFNITLRRYILSSLILDLFPLIVIFAILFMLLFLVSHNLLTQIYQILGTTASLFFSVILAHIRFKSNIPVQQIVFFEYFYFILHFLIISVTIISILYFLQIKARIISYENLLIPQLLYWPLVTGAILIISLINFY